MTIGLRSNTTSFSPLLSVLDSQHPEWRPLLAAIDEAVVEAERPSWADSVPAVQSLGRGDRPLLDGAVVELAPRTVARWINRVLSVNPVAAGFRRALTAGEIDPLLIMEIAVTQEPLRVAELARAINGDAAALEAQLPLIARPLVQACRRTWAASVPGDWRAGYCPVCGDWPVLAEARGFHGGRQLRCGGCGADWPGQWLQCPFCDERDPDCLGSLVSAETADRQSVEVCDGCAHYLKSVTSRVPMSADDVVLHDLTTPALDVAAADRGYQRVRGKGHALTVHIVRKRSRLRELIGLS